MLSNCYFKFVFKYNTSGFFDLFFNASVAVRHTIG